MKPKAQPANTCQHGQSATSHKPVCSGNASSHSCTVGFTVGALLEEHNSSEQETQDHRSKEKHRNHWRNTESLEQRAAKSYKTSKAGKEQIKACSSRTLSQVCCPWNFINAHRTRATAGLGKCSDSAQEGSSLSMLCFQTGANHTHKDKLQCTKGLLRNRDVTLGRFFTRQSPCPPPMYQEGASCRGCWKLEQHSLAENWPRPLSILLCHAKGSGRSYQFLHLAEHQPQRLLQLSCKRYFYSSAEKHSLAPQSSQVFPPCCAEANGY